MGLASNQRGQVLSGLNVAILVADGFEQRELTEPKHAMEAAGASTRIVSPRTGKIRGRNHDQEGDEFDVNLALDAADPREFDALLLPGGEANGRRISADGQARAFVQAMQSQGKPIAAICHGTSLLITAGLAQGHSITGAPDLQQQASAAGAHWQDQPVVVDGTMVSSRGPQDLDAFSEAAVEVLRRKVADSVAGTEDEKRGSGTSS